MGERGRHLVTEGSQFEAPPRPRMFLAPSLILFKSISRRLLAGLNHVKNVIIFSLRRCFSSNAGPLGLTKNCCYLESSYSS